MDAKTIHKLVIAADFLEIRGLLKRCAQEIAKNIKGKTIEHIQTFFYIPKVDDNDDVFS